VAPAYLRRNQSHTLEELPPRIETEEWVRFGREDLDAYREAVARRVAQQALALAVREARAEGWSWDRISVALGGSLNGETLRRNFSDE